MGANNHHGDGHIVVWLPALSGLQAGLIGTSPGVYFNSPYVGVKQHPLGYPDDLVRRAVGGGGGRCLDRFSAAAPRRSQRRTACRAEGVTIPPAVTPFPSWPLPPESGPESGGVVPMSDQGPRASSDVRRCRISSRQKTRLERSRFNWSTTAATLRPCARGHTHAPLQPSHGGSVHCVDPPLHSVSPEASSRTDGSG